MMIAVSWVLVLVFCRLVESTWWGAGTVLALVMTTSAVGTALFAPEYYTSPSANLFIQIMTAVVAIGGAIGRSVRARPVERVTLGIRRPLTFFSAGLVASLVALSLTIRSLGLGFADVLDINGLAMNIQTATYTRYTEGLSLPLMVNIANAVTLCYAAVMTASFVERRKVTFYMLLPVMIYCLSNLVITSRAPILMLLVIVIFSAIYAETVASPRHEPPRLLSRSHLIVGLLAIISVVCVFYYFQTLRFGPESTRSTSEVWAHLRRWPFGSLPGFSLWYDGVARRSEGDMPAGFYTLMGIFDNLGIAERVAGGYNEYLFLTNSEPGNIYTAFRGLVADFDFVGTAVLMLVVGLLAGLSIGGKFFSVRVGMAVYILTVGFCAYSFVFSFWAYTSNILAVVMLPFALRVFCYNSPSHPRRIPSSRRKQPLGQV